MPLKQRLAWTVVLRLAAVITGFASHVVLGWRHRAVVGRG
jgi:hypothetical protein